MCKEESYAKSEIQKYTEGLSCSLKSSADANAVTIQNWGKNYQRAAGTAILGAHTGLERICVTVSQKEKTTIYKALDRILKKVLVQWWGKIQPS